MDFWHLLACGCKRHIFTHGAKCIERTKFVLPFVFHIHTFHTNINSLVPYMNNICSCPILRFHKQYFTLTFNPLLCLDTLTNLTDRLIAMCSIVFVPTCRKQRTSFLLMLLHILLPSFVYNGVSFVKLYIMFRLLVLMHFFSILICLTAFSLLQPHS